VATPEASAIPSGSIRVAPDEHSSGSSGGADGLRAVVVPVHFDREEVAPFDDAHGEPALRVINGPELTRPQASPPSLAGGVVALGRSPQVARGRVEVQVLRVLARSRLYYRLRDGSIIGSGQPEGVRADDAAARHAAVAVRGV